MKEFISTQKGKVVVGIVGLVLVVGVISICVGLFSFDKGGAQDNDKKDSQAIHSIEKEDTNKKSDSDKKADAGKKTDSSKNADGEGLTVSDSKGGSANSESTVEGSELFGESDKDQSDTPSDNTDKDNNNSNEDNNNSDEDNNNTDKDNTEKEKWGSIF